VNKNVTVNQNKSFWKISRWLWL